MHVFSISFNENLVIPAFKGGRGYHEGMHMDQLLTSPSRRYFEATHGIYGDLPELQIINNYYEDTKKEPLDKNEFLRTWQNLNHGETLHLQLTTTFWLSAHSTTLHVIKDKSQFHLIYVDRASDDTVLVFSPNEHERQPMMRELLDIFNTGSLSTVWKHFKQIKTMAFINNDLSCLLKKEKQKSGNCAIANSNFTWHMHLISQSMQRNPELSFRRAYENTKKTYKNLRYEDRKRALKIFLNMRDEYTSDDRFKRDLMIIMYKINKNKSNDEVKAIANQLIDELPAYALIRLGIGMPKPNNDSGADFIWYDLANKRIAEHMNNKTDTFFFDESIETLVDYARGDNTRLCLLSDLALMHWHRKFPNDLSALFNDIPTLKRLHNANPQMVYKIKCDYLLWQICKIAQAGAIKIDVTNFEKDMVARIRPVVLERILSTFTKKQRREFLNAYKDIKDVGVYIAQHSRMIEPYDHMLNPSTEQGKLFLNELEGIKKKSQTLKKKGHIKAAEHAFKLYETIQTSYDQLRTENIDDETFKRECFQAISHARPELETHRGWKQILGNLVLAIIGLGFFYAVAGVINKATTGQFLFFKTDSADMVDKLEKRIDSKYKK